MQAYSCLPPKTDHELNRTAVVNTVSGNYGELVAVPQVFKAAQIGYGSRVIDIGSGICALLLPAAFAPELLTQHTLGIGQVVLQAAAMGFHAVGVENEEHRHAIALV